MFNRFAALGTVSEARRLRDVVRAVWSTACEYDRIPVDLPFVGFNKNNPHVQTYYDAMDAYLNYRKENNV